MKTTLIIFILMLLCSCSTLENTKPADDSAFDFVDQMSRQR